MKRGLVSVTFRQLPCEEIIRLCRENGLSYIEWGGDIHVPAGDTGKAAEVAELCRAAGVTPLGYGSYYNASDDFARFQPVLDTARALGAGYVRIWAGKSREYDSAAEENIKKAVLEAKRYGIAVCLECHRWTMTDDPGLAVRLAQRTGCLLHFQPNPDITFEENLSALQAFSPYLCALHVFAWEKGEIRLPLSRHTDQWVKYATAAGDVPFLLEFVAENDPENLKNDAAALAAILEICDENRA